VTLPVLTAPEVAVLRMTAELIAGGTPPSDRYVVDRTVTARGILLNPGNRNRYGAVLDDLIIRGYLTGSPTSDLDGTTLVDITDLGYAALIDQQNGRTS
jgi:hypothetical protein